VVATPLALLAADAVTRAEADACGDKGSVVCLLTYRRTSSVPVARAADWLVAKPLKIAIILLLAVLLLRLVDRGVRRFIAGLARAPMPHVAGDAAGVGPGGLATTTTLNPRAMQRAETVGIVLRSVARAGVWAVVALLVLGELGIQLAPLIAGAGIAGIALGFGAQSLVKDFIAGLFMIVEDQFGVGDVVDLGEATGTVEGISLRTTRVRDVHGTVWHIPNGAITRVGNKSQQWSRALLDVEVAYDADLDEATRVIKATADEVWRDEAFAGSVLEEPEVWGIEDFGASGVAIRLVVKTSPADQWKVMRALRSRLKTGLDAAGIELSHAQRNAWLKAGPTQ
jgi:small conductance mechanosensitive channel